MVTLMTLALCENEGRVGVTGLEIGDVSIDGVTGLDGTGVFTMVLDDDVCDLDGTGDDDEKVDLLNILTLSLCTCSNGRSSKIKIYRY